MDSFAQDHRKSQQEPRKSEPGRKVSPESTPTLSVTESAALPRYLSPQWVLQLEPEPDTQQTQAQKSTAPDSPTSGVMSGGLTPPSMLRPQDPYSRYLPDYASQFRLQPSTQILLGSLLDPARVAASVAARAQGLGGNNTTGTLAPTLPHVPLPPGTGWAPPPASPKPQTGILNPPPQADSGKSAQPMGNEVSEKPYTGPPKTASAGDVVSAVMAVPSVSALLANVKNDFLKRASSEWETAGTGDKALFIAHSVVVSSFVIAPILGFEDSRNFVLPLVSNTVIPVPGLPGYGVSFEFSERQLMVGAHLDVGSLLPSFLGFGSSSLAPFGSPSQTPVLPPPPIYPDREAGAQPRFDTGTIAQRLRTEQGRGQALRGDLAASVGNALNTDLSGVAIHDDARAHTLARDLHARAFTVGSDIYFSAGRYQPHSAAGRELLLHELTHVAQQARGPVQGHPIGAGLSMSKPDDTHETEARMFARQSTGAATEQNPPVSQPAVNQDSNQYNNRIQRQEEEEEELVAYGDAPDKRYTVMTTTGPRTNLTREGARALLRNNYHAINLQYELGSGAHRELKKARDGSVLIGIGGWLTDLAGDNLPPLSIWDSTGAQLDAANASLAGGNLEAAGSALFSAALENNKAATTYNAYLNQLESSANWATAGIVVVAVVAVVAYAVIATAAAGTSATGVAAGGATGTAEAVSGTATTVAATETAAGTGMATAAGAEITSGAVLEVIQTVAASMGNTQALHAYLTQLAASPAGRALLLAAARTAVAMSTQPEATRQEFQLLKQISELLFLFARGG